MPAAAVMAVAFDSRPLQEVDHRALYKAVEALSAYSEDVETIMLTCSESIAEFRASLVDAGKAYE
jgi:hypothetical protein